MSDRVVHGAWYIGMGLLTLAGRLAGECVDPDMYMDIVTHICHRCDEICDPVRQTGSECQQQCPEVYEKIAASRKSAQDDEMPVSDENAWEPKSWHSILGVVLTAVVAIIVVLVILAIRKIRRRSKAQRNNHRPEPESNHSSSARVAPGNGDYPLPLNYLNRGQAPNEIVPTSPEEDREEVVPTSPEEDQEGRVPSSYRPLLGRQHSRSESSVMCTRGDTDMDSREDWVAQDYRRNQSSSILPRGLSAEQGLHQLAPTPQQFSSVRFNINGSQGYESSDPVDSNYDLGPRQNPVLTPDRLRRMNADAAEDSGTETPVKYLSDSRPEVAAAELSQTLSSELSDDIELGMRMNEA